MTRQRIIEYVLTYAFAISVSLLALVISLLLGPVIGTATPGLLFFPAVIISAWYGGLVAGVISTVTSGLILEFYYLPQYNLTVIRQVPSLIQVSLFLVEGVLISFFIDSGKRRNNLTGKRRKESEYLQIIASLEEKYKKAQEEIRFRDEFLSVASHELKTPLTSMLLQIQAALHNIRNVSLAQFSVEHLMAMLKNTENQTKRLSRMINDLLQVSIITTGKLDLELEEVNMTGLVNEILQDFSERLERDNYTINFKKGNAVIGHWDRVRIEQAVTNLISNAIKYGNKQPIDISVGQSHSIAKLTIRDHGIGVSKKQQTKVFELFERGVSQSEYRGLGVGLYITDQIVKAHGGKLLLHSKEGKGATFTIELPIKNSVADTKGKLSLLLKNHTSLFL